MTGIDSSNAALLVAAGGSALLAVDGRYVTAAAESAPELELAIDRAVAPTLAGRARSWVGDHGGASGRFRLAVEKHHLTLAVWELVEKALGETGADAEVLDLDRAVERLRAVKDDAELELLRQACAISCQALEDLVDAGGFLGRTEKEIAHDLERRMADHGADGAAFETIVASGSNSAIPHHRPTLRRVERGDFLKIDFGAVYQGYRADCTRTFVVGAEPAGWQREIYDVVAEAQRAGREALRRGQECVAVDAASRAVVAAAGHGERFTHSTGHGVGLEIHEAPTLGYNAPGTLADRMVVTVEPGVYLPGRGGVRIEDTLAVRAAGGPELLTPTGKDLLVLDG